MSHVRYVQGHEPSAPPAPSQYGGEDGPNFTAARSRQGASGAAYGNQSYPPGGPAGGGYAGPQKTVGQHILEVFMDAFFHHSHTTARVDLVRPRRRKGPTLSNHEEGPAGPTPTPASSRGSGSRNGASAPTGAYYGGQVTPGNGYAEGPPYDSHAGERSWRSGLQGLSGIQGRGARLKIMQIWDFPNEEGKSGAPWGLNFGLGANFDMDRSELQPKCRVRGKYAALHLLPQAELELKAKWNLGISDMAVDLRYRLPLASAHRFWDGESGARLLINLFHPFGTGVHLSPGGLEFDERVWQLGKHTHLRAAATLDFPRRIPFDEQPVRIHMHRLGLKTRLT